MNIAIDMFGGDNAPQEITRGILHFLHTQKVVDADLFLIGDELKLKSLSPELSFLSKDCRFIPETNSTIACGLDLLKANNADVFITAGNSAELVKQVVRSGLSSNNRRPAAPAFIPQLNGGYSILCDVGINIDCSSGDLNHIAQLASGLAKEKLFLATPRVALLNIGQEEGKGDDLVKKTYSLLSDNTAINFIGNIEGNDIIHNKADVIVCDGFTGNIVLKLIESFAILDPRFSFEDHGGTILLGVEKNIILGHGRSTAKAFENMLVQALAL